MRRLFAAILVFSACALAEGAAIHLESGAFRVTGWQPGPEPAAGWSSVLAIYAGAGDVPPLLGSYAVEDGSLIFRPRFPATPGTRLRAVLRIPGTSSVETVFNLPKADLAPTTRVAHVYPSTGLLPENELKFYVYFSAPMSKGEAWQHLRLLREDGSIVELPFLELDQELWDRDHTRLTVLFDPGRIKRGVLPLQEIGSAIEPGKRYTLVIDRDWPDARNVPLSEEFRKAFQVGPADRTPPDPSKWRVTAPRAGTSDALVIDFREPMDFALLHHMLEVSGPAGAINGDIAVAREEAEWRFTPRVPWKAGAYRVIVQTALEDLAGNHVGRPFDVDTFDPISKTISRETVDVPVRIR